ncbi:MAG TPA: hypothetical protein VH520_09675 [Streptosporangiaceae bacterium]|jgi:hypothetical protein
MRRESSTVIALVGGVSGGLLAGLAESPNVAVVRPAAADQVSQAGQGRPSSAVWKQGASGAAPEPSRHGWEHGALAMHDAARRRATYVVVPADPLAGVAAAWRAMWDVSSGPDAAVGFEEAAADTLIAWRANRFELPDYYLVIAPPEDTTTGPDLYLGPVRAARPHRVAIAASAPAGDPATADTLAGAIGMLDTLRSLPHGPWWPPLDELLDAARHFYAGGLAEPAQTPV